MSKQQSKRYRTIHKAKESLPNCNVNGYSGSVFDDRLWIYRTLEDESAEDLKNTMHLIENMVVCCKIGHLTLSVMYPGEIRRATKRSLLRGLVSIEHIAEELDMALPASLNEPVLAEVKGLGQYNSSVGANVHYPNFKDERKSLTNSLNNIFGVKCSWDTRKAHISIAKGQLANLQEIDLIQETLPSEVLLSPAVIAINK